MIDLCLAAYDGKENWEWNGTVAYLRGASGAMVRSLLRIFFRTVFQ